MEEAIIAGMANATEMAGLAKGRLREKRKQLDKALEGRVKSYQRFVLSELQCQVNNLDETIARFDAKIEKYCRPFEEAVELLDTIPGIASRTAVVIVSEIGSDMRRFPTANHLAAWAGVTPGNNESAGKSYSGTTRHGDRALTVALVRRLPMRRHRSRNTYLSAQYHRLAARRRKKRATVAEVHSILVISYHIIQGKEPYRDLGSDYFDKHCPEATIKRLVRRLQYLGYDISRIVQPLALPAAT